MLSYETDKTLFIFAGMPEMKSMSRTKTTPILASRIQVKLCCLKPVCLEAQKVYLYTS